MSTITSGEAAELLGVNRRTILRWRSTWDFPADTERVAKGQPRKFDRLSVIDWATERDIYDPIAETPTGRDRRTCDVCKRGHDKNELGRDPTGGCSECRRVRQRINR